MRERFKNVKKNVLSIMLGASVIITTVSTEVLAASTADITNL